MKLKLDLNIHIIHFPTIHLPVWKEAVDGWKVETLVSQLVVSSIISGTKLLLVSSLL